MSPDMGDSFVCHHMEVDTSEIRNVVQNPTRDPESDFTHVTKENRIDGMIRKFDRVEMHGFECPDCGKQKLVCPVCMGNGEFIGNSTNERLTCHACSQY